MALTANEDTYQNPDLDAKLSTRPSASAPLLRGMLLVSEGKRLTPTHTRKGKQRYRYYLSSARTASPFASNIIRLPTDQIERLIKNSVLVYLTNADTITRLMRNADITLISTVRQAAQKLAEAIRAHEDTVRTILSEVTLGEGTISIGFHQTSIADALGVAPSNLDAEKLQLIIPYTRRRRGNEIKLVASSENAESDRVLVRTLAHSLRWLKMLQDGVSFEEIAARENHSTSYIRTRMPMAKLSPSITLIFAASTRLSTAHLASASATIKKVVRDLYGKERF